MLNAISRLYLDNVYRVEGFTALGSNLWRALRDGDIEGAVKLYNTALAGIPYQDFTRRDERNFNGIAEESAMGNIGVFADSTRVNMQNPATLSELKYTAFSAGMTMQSKKIVTNNTSINARSSAFDYFTLGFPIIDRLGVSFGLVPYSSVGYQLKSETYGTTYQYQGNGNVNQFFASAGYKLRQGLSLGATVRYNFGTMQRDRKSVVERV